MKETLGQQLAEAKQKIEARLKPVEGGREPRQSGHEFQQQGIRYEFSERIQAIAAGGIGAIHKLCARVGLISKLDAGLKLLKHRRPYSEADHVLNIAFNLLCGGRVLDDIETLRKDVGYLDALGARTIPDPTTAGDYCRRFHAPDIHALMGIFNEVRVGVWRNQPRSFFAKTARIDADGTMVTTAGGCKEGMDKSYTGVWGYHPLVVTLANTGEVLYIANRSGNRPSEEGAPSYFSMAISLCREAGFKDILLRGDTAFSQAWEFDNWDKQKVRFVFGYDAFKGLVRRADALPEDEYIRLERAAEQALRRVTPRAKQPRIKEQLVCSREYKNIRLIREDLAEFQYTPSHCVRPYRIVVLRKTLEETRGAKTIAQTYRYYFYITNDEAMSRRQVVREANDRCTQENVLDELKNGVRALHSPLNNLDANWAYMVIASLAWSLKAWFALMLPRQSQQRKVQVAERERVLAMDFRTFLRAVVLVPAQILHTGRRLIFRLLAWRPELPILFRLLDAL